MQEHLEQAKGFSPRAPGPVNTLLLDLRPPEVGAERLLWFKPWCSWKLITAAQGRDYKQLPFIDHLLHALCFSDRGTEVPKAAW